MPLTPGTTLGSYSVIAKIGEGGMGEVYQARDTKLDRDVALKVLPEAFTADPDRLARFEREAKVLASLNHPNIGSIYGLEEAEGVKALVLELIEGPTLADRIAQGPIPVDEALPIAKQIAEALEAAHEQGVIHRDLKPANVKVKTDGTVKVLDFGLAKALDPSPTGDPDQSPTLTAAATQMGVIMGTAAYMSPEQARGKPVDKRADIWAFGVVLYEMLSGNRPFEGEDVSLMLASVMKSDLSVATLPSDLPANVRTVLRRCLEKNTNKRVRDAGDVRLALEGAFESAARERAEPSVAVPPRVWPRPGLAVIAALMLVGVTVLAVLAAVRPTSTGSRPLNRFSVSLPFDAAFNSRGLAISPDGRQFVYPVVQDGDGLLYLRSMSQLEATPIRGTNGANLPFFSPDGASVGFFDVRTNTLKRVALSGGPPVTISSLDGSFGPQFRGGSWGDDGTIVFGSAADRGLLRVSAAGGEPQSVTSVNEAEDELYHAWVHVLPGGEDLLYAIRPGGQRPPRIVTQSVATGARTELGEGTSPTYVRTGHLLFARERSLWAAPFDLDRRVATGEATPVIEDLQVDVNGAAHYAVADDGTLVYARTTGLGARRLVWLDRAGRQEPVPGLRNGDYQTVRISPDSGRIAFVDGVGGRMDVWTYDVQRTTRTLLTLDPSDDVNPVWTADSEAILFGSNRDGQAGLYRVNADGTGTVERLYTDGRATSLHPHDVTADGRLLFSTFPFPINLAALTIDGDQPRTPDVFLASEFTENHATLSPDGAWLAYSSDRSGQSEIYVERFPDMGSRQLVSIDGGSFPLWSPNGQELFYIAGGTQLMSMPTQTQPALIIGTPEIVFDGPIYAFGSRRTYDITPDGQRLLLVLQGVAPTTDADARPGFVVVQNWLDELERSVPLN